MRNTFDVDMASWLLFNVQGKLEVGWMSGAQIEMIYTSSIELEGDDKMYLRFGFIEEKNK